MPAERVFWNQKRPLAPLSIKAIQKKIERYAKAAGIKASCHSLRHTFAWLCCINRFDPSIGL